MTQTGRCVLIDGHSLAYRAFYALPPDLATSSGQVTNAVYGFTSMLIKILEELKPVMVLVAFDKGQPEFRTQAFPEYKAHRKPMPDELKEQMGIIHAVLEALRIPSLEREGYEADDVLATVAGMLGDRELYIVTGDRDALQLVGEGVRVMANRKGITDMVVYDREKVKERYGVEPAQIVDYLALKGDASDNIPGVPGIGEKNAAALISRFGSLDGVYEHLEEVEGSRVRRSLEENRDLAYLSRDLARMRADVPLEEADPTSWELEPWDDEEVQRVFSSLEFRKLYQRLQELKPLLFPAADGNAKAVAADLECKEVVCEAEVEEALRDCLSAGEASLYARLEGEGYTRGSMHAACVSTRGLTYRFDLEDDKGRVLFGSFLQRLLERKGARLNCFRGKDVMVQCERLFGTRPAFDFDVELASYLVDPSLARYDLEILSRRYLGCSLEEKESGQIGLLEEEKAHAGEDARKSLTVEALVPHLEAEMGMRGLRPLFEDVEMPLQEVLAEMEISGIRLDTGVLEGMREELERELAELERHAYELAGESFNLSSPQQISHILFEVLGLTPVRRTKTGYATDVGVLTTLRDVHPLPDLLLRHRELSKLLNTYVAALPRMVDKTTGRLHACFNQAVTATGRLSSSSPNLQNIPIRTPLGREIRRAFLPTSDGGCILSAD